MTYRDTVTETKTEFILPESQKKIVEMVTKIAAKHGVDVKIVDTAKESALCRRIKREPKTKVFPTLIVSSRERIESEMTKEQIESLLSHSR